jgi:hypothetical protein
MSYTLPAGTYVIGDPCYNLTDAQFDEFLQTSESLTKAGTVTLADGTTRYVQALYTASGDGRFKANGFEYAVDSASIGIMPIEALEGREPDESTKVVKFKSKFDVYDSAGTLVFGHIEINTHDEPEEDEDDGFTYGEFDDF